MRSSVGRGVWRHRNFLDIDMEILKVQYRGPNYIKCKVVYWRREYGKSPAFLIDPRPETVKIMRDEFSNWKYIL